MKCKICGVLKTTTDFYATRSLAKKTGKLYTGFRRECKPCTLNRNERERDAWKDGLYRVYILPKEHYCGYTNNIRHRSQQHAREGRDISGMVVVFESKDPVLAHYIETEYHLNGYLGFGPSVGAPTLRKYRSRRDTNEQT